MISIIICSANRDDLLRVSRNIEETIGLPFEIISFDNSDGKRGICDVYNEGAGKAKYDTLCFMHEDIQYITENWGQKLVDIFSQHPKVGLVGVAGGGYKSVAPSSWHSEIGDIYCNLIQGFRRSGKPDAHDYRNPRHEKLSIVASVDGCWLCTRKSVALEIPFDEHLLKGFHGYDMDFSLAVNQQYQVAVTFEILMKHFSEGNFDIRWLEEILKVHKKWSSVLPVNRDGIPEGDLMILEKRAFRLFLQKSLDNGISYGRLVPILWDARHSKVTPLKIVMKLYFALLKMKPVKADQLA